MEALASVVIVAIIVIWVRKRKRSAKETLELSLAVVGFEASGKTVFVGSMFNELRVPDDHGVFLDTSPENASKLLALYNTTADTDKKFPVPPIRAKWSNGPSPSRRGPRLASRNSASSRYLDFAGESLRDLYTGVLNPETQRLYDHFRNADVLMAALDGLQVKRFMENRPLPGFYEDLGTCSRSCQTTIRQ